MTSRRDLCPALTQWSADGPAPAQASTSQPLAHCRASASQRTARSPVSAASSSHSSSSIAARFTAAGSSLPVTNAAGVTQQLGTGPHAHSDRHLSTPQRAPPQPRRDLPQPCRAAAHTRNPGTPATSQTQAPPSRRRLSGADRLPRGKNADLGLAVTPMATKRAGHSEPAIPRADRPRIHAEDQRHLT